MNKHVDNSHVVAPDIEVRLERLAERLNVPVAKVLEDGLVDYLDRADRRAELYSELDRRYDRYVKTGLHVTNAEVKQWLLERARGERTPPPKAHN